MNQPPRRWRVAVGGISHETTTMVDRPTTVRDFEEGFGLFRGAQISERFRETNTCTGGFLAVADSLNLEIVPLLWGFAYPSGLIQSEAYTLLKHELLERLNRADAEERIDGVLLDQHGSMVVDGIDDADGDLIESVRRAIGPERPLMVTTDLHSNHTLRRVAQADAIVGFDTYPHVDMAERGREAATLLARTLRGEIRPAMAIRQLPLFWGTRCQVSAHPPFNEVLEMVHALERRPGVLAVTVATSFPWADVPEVGSSVIVVADGDRSRAQEVADDLGDWIWKHRERWRSETQSVAQALERGERLGRYPIILADHADNTGGGAPGDSTEVLRTFVERGLEDALLLYLVDPETLEQAYEVGPQGRFMARLGGKSHPLQGSPVELEVEVMKLSDGRFAYDGPMYAGLTGNLGRSAWLRHGSLHMVLVTAREQPIDTAFARTLGIDCRKMKYIAVKSAAHFRSGFEPFAGSIHSVDAGAILTHDFRKLHYRARTRPVFPVELEG